MIYFDNGATSFPKPYTVVNAVEKSFSAFCANPGRGGYASAMKASEIIYNARNTVAKFFNTETENVVFTPGCTFSLNSAIKGVAKPNSHFVISDLEHNSVVRPLEKMKNSGVCDYSVAEVSYNETETVNNFVNEFRDNTIAVVCTLSSNVFGIMPPIEKIANEAHKHGIIFILDAAQGAGYLPVDVEKQHIDILCCAGHKGLLGPMGTGILICSPDINLDSLTEGGTGSNSENLNQPVYLPDKLESGTPNVHGIAGLSAGIKFIEKTRSENILNHENKIIKFIFDEFKYDKNITLYTNIYGSVPLAPVLSFNVKKKHSEEVATLLAEKGICVRGGLHCAPLAHKKMGTLRSGTVRITPSWFVGEKETDFLVNCVKKIAK